MDKIFKGQTQETYGRKDNGADMWKLTVTTHHNDKCKYAELMLIYHGGPVTLNDESIQYIEEAIKLYREIFAPSVVKTTLFDFNKPSTVVKGTPFVNQQFC